MSHKKVLIVDDEEDLCDIIGFQVEEMGYQTALAQSIKGAKACLLEGPIDLILSDMNMPDGGGLDIVNFLKSESKNIPVVLISGFCSVTEEQAKEQGAYCLMDKPINISQLEQVIREILSDP